MRVLLPLSAAALCWLSSCAGYQLGDVQPSHLQHVRSISVQHLHNETQNPRASVIATNSIVDALAHDGTYRVATAAEADAVIIGTIRRIDYTQFRADRLDTLRSQEYTMTVVVDWKLIDANNPSKVLEKGHSKGQSRFFAEKNINVSRANAMPRAMKRIGQDVTTQLANGF